MKRAIIFDLDMCILNTHSLSGPFLQPVLDALAETDLSIEIKDGINQHLWTTSLEDIVNLFSLSAEIAESLRASYRQMEVPDGIKTYGDENCLRNLPVTRILVTSGYRKFQETKIQKLGIADLFEEIIIDALDYPAERKGKQLIFQDFLLRFELKPDEVLVVGDNPYSELRAGRALQIPTVQTLRPTIERWDLADYHIESLTELAKIIAN